MAESPAGDAIEVIYATPDCQHVVEVAFEPGLTAGRAVERSGLLERCPEIAEQPMLLGIFGERVDRSRVLDAGDRVEILRPLHGDPRELRRRLSSVGRVMGRGGG